MDSIVMEPIGFVESPVHEKRDDSWGGVEATIRLRPEYADGIEGLGGFSHAIIVFQLNEAAFDSGRHLRRRPRNQADMPLLGIFAQRAKDRPNRIGVTAVEVLSVGDGWLSVKGLDAISGTPVLDIKPYMKVYDCRPDAVEPPFVEKLMRGYF